MSDQNLPVAEAPETKSNAAVVGRLAVQMGVGVGLVCGLWLLGLHLTDNNAFGPKRLLAYFLVPLAVVGSQWLLRQRLLRQRLLPRKPGMGPALAVGSSTAVVAAVTVALCVLGLATLAGEPAMERNRQEMLMIAKVERANIVKLVKEEGYQQQLVYLTKITPADLARQDFGKLLLALLFVLPGAVFYRE